MPGEVPEEWQERRLGDLCESIDRRLGNMAKLEVLSVAKRGVVPQSLTYDKEIASDDISRYRVIEPGEFGLAPMALYYGAIGRYHGDKPGIISPAYSVFRHKPDTDPAFLEALVRLPRMIARYEALSQGGNLEGKRKLTPFDAFATVRVLVPQLAEQRAIANALGVVETAISETAALIQAIAEARRALIDFSLASVFHQREDRHFSRLGDVAEVRTGIAKSKDRKLVDPVRLPYLRVANVQDGYLNLNEVKTIEVERTQVARYRLAAGDVLFNEGGDFDKLGRGCVWQGEIAECLHQNHVFVVRCGPAMLPAFLALQAASTRGKAYFRLSSKQTTNLASINTSDLRSFPVLVPPMDYQRHTAEIVTTWDERMLRENAFSEGLRITRDALAQELLSGRLRLPEGMIARHADASDKAA